MSWIDPVSTVIKAASLANSLAQSSTQIRHHASRIQFYIVNGLARIPVFGAGGVGKTTIGKVITSNNPLDISTLYDESLLIDQMSFQGDIPGHLLIAPGQIARVERHWPTLLSYIAQGKSFGFINVVSYGYHSFAIQSMTEHDLYEPGMRVDEFIEVYAKARRCIELELLRRVKNSLCDLQKLIWMVSIVNKQDLWWNQRQEVRRHYEQGEYQEILQTLASTIGEQNFQHEFIPCSLTIGNMRTPMGELLASTTAGYDQQIHLQYLQTLFDKLYTLIGQGKP